jgi:Cu+-exporting ATPase
MAAEYRNLTNGHEHGEAMARAGDLAIDPVCGMTVDTHAGKPTLEHEGHTYYVCS